MGRPCTQCCLCQASNTPEMLYPAMAESRMVIYIRKHRQQSPTVYHDCSSHFIDPGRIASTCVKLDCTDRKSILDLYTVYAILVVLDASHLKVVGRFKHLLKYLYPQYLMRIMILWIKWVCFMPEQTCYYVDLVNVKYMSNYVCLVYSVLWHSSVAKVQYHWAKETQSC